MLCGGIRGGIRGSRESGRTSRLVRVGVLPITRATMRHLRRRVRWRQCWGVRLVICALATSIARVWRLHWTTWTTLLRLLGVHGWLLLIPLRRRPILTWLLLLLRRVRVATARRQGLAVRAVKLRVRRRVLATPDCVSGHERLGLCADRSEDTLL